METIATDWSLIIQGVIQILTIVGSMWAIFTKKTQEIEQRIDNRMIAIENQMRFANQARKEEISKPNVKSW